MHALRRLLPMLLVVAVFLVGCMAKPLPEELASYAGVWQSASMSLAITADGQVSYRKVEGGATTKVTGPIQEYVGGNFRVGVACISTEFEVSSPPTKGPDGQWHMTVDGVELTKVAGG